MTDVLSQGMLKRLGICPETLGVWPLGSSAVLDGLRKRTRTVMGEQTLRTD